MFTPVHSGVFCISRNSKPHTSQKRISTLKMGSLPDAYMPWRKDWPWPREINEFSRAYQLPSPPEPLSDEELIVRLSAQHHALGQRLSIFHQEFNSSALNIGNITKKTLELLMPRSLEEQLFNHLSADNLSRLRDGQKLKIAVVAPPWFALPAEKYGGIEKIVVDQVRYLLKQGHDVWLFAPGDSQYRKFVEQRHIDNGQFHFVPIVNEHLRFDKVQKTMDREVSHETPISSHLSILQDVGMGAFGNTFDGVCSNVGYMLSPLDALLQAGQKKGKSPFILTTQHNPDKAASVIELLNRNPNFGWVSIGQHQLRTWERQRKYAAHIYNSIRPEEFPPRFEQRCEISKKDPLRIGSYGRVSSPEKGHLRAILATIRANELGIPTQLFLAGKINPEEKEYFKEKIEPYIDNKTIFYLGELDHTQRHKYLAYLDTMVHVGYGEEPFGLALAEAQCAGTPVVALNYASSPELVIDGVTGKLCAPMPESRSLSLSRDFDEVVDAIKNARNYDRRLIHDITRRRFHEQRMMAQYELAFYSALDRGRYWTQDKFRLTS